MNNDPKKFNDQSDADEKVVDISFKKAEQAKIPVELIKSSIDLANKTHRPLLDTLTFISSAIPPLKLIITGITGIWDIIHAVLLDKESSTLTKGTKIGLTLGIIAMGIAAIASPPLAGVFLVVAAGLALGKEFLGLGVAINVKEGKGHNFAVFDKAASCALAMSSVVGFAFLLTPLAPVGLGLLIGSAAAGVTIKLGPPLVKYAFNVFKALKNVIATKFFTKGEAEKRTEEKKEQEVLETTAKLSQQFPRGPEENAKSAAVSATKVEKFPKTMPKKTPSDEEEESFGDPESYKNK